MNDNNANALDVKIATIGNPFFVQIAKNLGACPLKANPYRIRLEQNKNELPAENADVKIAALTILGRILIPARVMAMT